MATNNPRITPLGITGLSLLILTGAVVVIVLVTFMFGGIEGTEFNPQSFERRRFGFYEVPLIRLQVTPLWRREANGEVESLVAAQKYVIPTPGAPETWHLIALERSSYTPPPTDVQILARYLDAQNEHDRSYWADWSSDHPDMAAVLWPEVARLARLELYPLLPPLFELARNSDNLATFQADLKQLQTKQLQDLADRYKERTEKVEDEKAKDQLSARVVALEEAAKTAGEEIVKDRKKEAEERKKAEEEKEKAESAKPKDAPVTASDKPTAT
jgi:hypothetical protein